MIHTLIKTASLAGLTALATPLTAAVDLEFYFPVAVGGAAADTIEKLTAEYAAAHPEVSIKAVYAGSYSDAGQKALTAARVGQAAADFGVAVHADVRPDRRRRHRAL